MMKAAHHGSIRMEVEGQKTLYTVSRGMFTLHVFQELSSTNNALKVLAAEKPLPEGTVLWAKQQYAGRGRLGRSFFSPADSGLYFSFLLRPPLPTNAAAVTTAAAVAVSQSLCTVTGEAFPIKWVNDIYHQGKKVCGILAEQVLRRPEEAFVVVGVGINLYPPVQGFPQDLAELAGTVFSKKQEDYMSQLILWDILRRFWDIRPRLSEMEHMDYYRRHSLLTGRQVEFYRQDTPLRGVVEDISPAGELVIRLTEGGRLYLGAGEVQVLPGSFND